MPDEQAGRDTPGERPRTATAALDATMRRVLDDLDTLITTLSARSDKGLSEISTPLPGDTLLASPAVFTARCAELLTTRSRPSYAGTICSPICCAPAMC